MNLQELEKSAIARASEMYGGEKRAMAEALGISLATLYRKLGQMEKKNIKEQ